MGGCGCGGSKRKARAAQTAGQPRNGLEMNLARARERLGLPSQPKKA
jgi:hypothetical protein